MNEKTSGTKSPIRKLRRLLPIAAVLLVLAVLCVAPVGADDTTVTPVEIKATYEWYTSVSEGDTYTINTIDNLTGLAKLTQGAVSEAGTNAATNFAGKTVILGADLAFADGQYWYYNDGTNTYDYIIKEFAGTFDGQNHKITGLKFSTTTSNSKLGLFGTITADGIVTNLVLDGVTAEMVSGGSFGSIAQTVLGKVSDCSVNNVKITLDGYSNAKSGALFAFVKENAVIDNCDVTNVVSNCIRSDGGNDNVDGFGGVIGNAANAATIKNCDATTVTMSFSAKTKSVGGFIGGVGNTVVMENCILTDLEINTAGWFTKVGGFAGITTNTPTFKGCAIKESALNPTEASQTGGFVGEANGAVNFVECVVSDVEMNIGADETSSHGSFGGFAGQTNGGIAGTPTVFNGCVVENLDMTVKGEVESSIGGFITAVNTDVVITDCSASGNIDAVGNTNEKPVGGFVGDLGWSGSTAINAKIEECDTEMDITASGDAGGFVASAQGNNDSSNVKGTLTVTDSTASGKVTSTNGAAGGFVGTGNRGTFDGCEANGAVSGETAGGFWGVITPNPTTVDNKDLTITGSNANGQVLGTTTASGFVGTVTTTKDDGSNVTPVKIEGSTAAPVVAGATSTTEINDFAKDETPEGVESQYNDKDENNVPPTTTVKPTTDSGEKLTINENGNIVIPDGVSADVTTGGATTTIKPTTNGGDAPSINNAGQITTPKDVSLDVTTEDGATVTVKPTTDADLTLDNGNIVIPSGVTTEVTTGGVTTTITPTTDAPITSDSEGNIVIPEDVVITYTVTFNSNEGSSEIVTVEKGQTIALNNPFTSENTFAGWSTIADGAILYENGETVTVTEHLTFYARWTTPTSYEVGDDDKAKLDAAVAGDFKEVFAEVEGSFYAEITLLGANGQPDHQTEITFTVPYPSGITATGYTFVVLHYNETSFQVEQIADSKVNPTASGLKITSTVSPFIIGYSAISNGNGGGNGGNGGGSSTPQGSSVWLTEPLTPTPTETAQPTPTDVAPTDIPTTQPTQTETQSPLSVLSVLAGLGAVAVLRRK